MSFPLDQDTDGEPQRPKRRTRLRRLRRMPLLLLLVLVATSCTRARTTGLMAPDTPAFAYRETSVELPGSKPDVRIEGYYTRPSPAGTYPCAVILHGKGGWWRAYIRYAQELAAQGIASVIVNYYSGHWVDLEGLNVPFDERRAQFEYQNGDIAAAVTAFSRYPVCAGRKVGLIGFSLGADKAFRTAAAQPDIGAVVGYYGPYDYVSFIRQRVNPVLLALAGEEALKWKAYLEKNSPFTLAGRVRASALLFHGVEDSTIPVKQSILMQKALGKRGGPGARMKLYEGVGHNFVLRRRGTRAERADSIRLTVSFLKKKLIENKKKLLSGKREPAAGAGL